MNLSRLADLTADNIKQFGRDALLSEFIILELKLVKQFLGIVVGALHSHHTGSLLGSAVFTSASFI